MPRKKQKSPDDPASAPESGTDRDESTGNQPSHPEERPAPVAARPGKRPATEGASDEPTVAGEER